MDELDIYGQPYGGGENWPKIRQGLSDALRGVSYYPYDLIGAPVDIINMALKPVGLGSEQPVLGSDYLRNIAKSLGLAQDPTGSVPETAARIGAGFINPAAAARTVGQIPQTVTKAANLSADKLVQMITRNPEATAPQVLQETSMPFLNAVAPKAPSLLQPQKSDLGFYSQLEAATIPLQNKGTGEQYLAQISKAPGVKPEELQWTGLDEFLKSRRSVTKAEIQDYLNANRVDVREVRLGDEIDPEEVRLFMQDEAGQGFTYDEAVEYLRDGDSVTKFSSYTLPGGENYREILLTLPEKKLPLDEFLESAGKKYGGDTPRYQWSAEDNATYERLLKEDPSVPRGYRSGHFDQPNILAHMRVNDRVVDGKKTLFIEEVQSDWHQAGRKKGYDTPEARAAEQQKLDNILVERQALLDEQLRLEELAQPFTSQGKDAPREIVDQWSIVSNRLNNLQTEQNRLGRGFGQQVPDAPFKTSWHELTLKRAIQEASEKGYDQIAFTTGKTQAERYDLSKQIKTIVYGQPDDSGRRTVRAITPNGDQLLGGKYTMSEIEDNIGKEMAEKIQKSTGEFDQRTGTYAMSGLDLQVGGEGMKGFYDNILPKSLEKLGKKFDAKVTKSKMSAGKDIVEPGLVAPGIGMEFAGKVTKAPDVEIWTMQITPKMRESVTTKGQPLFAIPAIGTGLLGSQMMQED